MPDEHIEAAKAALRNKARTARAALSPSFRAQAAKDAAEHFFREVTLAPAETIAGYWSIRDEMDCRPILLRLMDTNQPVCLPVVLGDDQPLELRLWEQGSALYEAGFGTLAPAELAPVVEPDVILMPLLGFDGTGTRLGYGGGYYDRTFAAISKDVRLIGLAFSAQEIATIPHEPHDVPLDAIVTETGVRIFARDT
jgi:5-formyltetrahydrofolate cyclo-ligase